MDSVDRENMCPVCGYGLWFRPWGPNGSASDEFCPCCGIQFGYHDVTDGAGEHGTKEEIWVKWRKRWIEAGMKWADPGSNPPHRWNPTEQLRRVSSDV